MQLPKVFSRLLSLIRGKPDGRADAPEAVPPKRADGEYACKVRKVKITRKDA